LAFGRTSACINFSAITEFPEAGAGRGACDDGAGDDGAGDEGAAA
jgi:hypothetical protein